MANGIMGKYKGIKVYKTTYEDYVNNRNYLDMENMYCIGDEIIYKNEIFANFDGRVVDEIDSYKRVEFYKVPKVVVKDRGVSWTDTLDVPVSVEIPNIDFKSADEILAGVYC